MPYFVKSFGYIKKNTSKKNGRIMLLLKCVVCDGKKSKFIKEQEASGLLIINYLVW